MKKLWILFLLLTVINALLFVFKDRLQYLKYSTYNELYAPCNESCKEKWGAFMRPYNQASLNEARRLLQPLGLDTASSLSKIIGIGHHLYTKFNAQAGYPKGALHYAAPLDCYKILSADTAQKVWCGTYAVMFSFFCWSQNIVCRNIEIFKPGDHHMLNECWVPEINRWVMVDVTNNIVRAEKSGQPLNTQDFVKAIGQPGSIALLSAGTMERKSLSAFEQSGGVNAYYNAAYPFYYYHLTQPSEVYKPVEKLKRYFLPYYWYEIFSLEPKNNAFFWAKLFFAALWLILAGAMLTKKFIP